MSIDDYWENSDPTLFWAYRTSFNFREKRKQEVDNFNAWLSGLYINEAVSVVIHNTFCRKNENESLESYISEPYDFKDIQGQRERIESERNRIAVEQRIRAMTSNISSSLNKNRKE